MPEKLEMPISYFSQSSFGLFMRDPMAWYMQYMVGRVEKKGPALTKGKIFQIAWSDRKYDYAKELKKAGFNSDIARAMKMAVEHPQTVRLPKSKTEKTIIVKGLGLKFPILAQFDGIDEKINLIIENKFGVVWNQKRVDDGVYYDSEGRKQQDWQITWYILVYYIKYGRMPEFLLQSYNGKHGVPTQLWAKRTMYDLDKLVSDINYAYDRVMARNFDKI